jgi:NADH:ubiquinone oxidoreductase subunit 6 (subunit J)
MTMLNSFSLFALLGFSVFLRGKNEVRNRLVLYLNVFVFAYGFQSGVTALSITPLVPGGVSMIAKVGLALIPCTVILAICTILGTGISKLNSIEKYGLLDVFAIVASVAVLYAFSVTRVTEYLNHSPWLAYRQFTIFKLGWDGWFGPLLFAALLLPMAVQESKSGIDMTHNRNRVVGFLRRYIVPFICLAILLVIICLGTYYSSPNSVLLGVVIGGVVSGISLFLGQVLVDWYNRPILEIDEVGSPIPVLINRESGRYGKVDDTSLESIPYMVNRIRVSNNGRTAAKNCKAALVSETDSFRELVCWSIPRERYIMTINAKDTECVDLCAVIQVDPGKLLRDQNPPQNPNQNRVYGNKDRTLGATLRVQDIPRRIVPTEEGWLDGKPVRDNKVLDQRGEGDLHFTIVITAENASPYETKVTILERQDGQGRMVSFS